MEKFFAFGRQTTTSFNTYKTFLPAKVILAHGIKLQFYNQLRVMFFPENFFFQNVLCGSSVEASQLCIIYRLNSLMITVRLGVMLIFSQHVASYVKYILTIIQPYMLRSYKLVARADNALHHIF